jgi:hypothetical protein
MVLGVALLQAVQVFYQRDVVWAACSILLYVALCLNSEGKSPPVFIALVLSACLIFVSLVSSIGECRRSHARKESGLTTLPSLLLQDGVSSSRTGRERFVSSTERTRITSSPRRKSEIAQNSEEANTT